jgi:hypothetical protein
LSQEETLFSSPLPVQIATFLEIEFSAPVSLTTVAVLNRHSISVEYSAVSIPANQVVFLDVHPLDKLTITTADTVFEWPFCPGICFVYLRVQSPQNFIVKFRVGSDFTASENSHLVVERGNFFQGEKPAVPIGSIFSNCYHSALEAKARNALLKEIYLDLLPQIEVKLPVLVDLVHSLLCDSVPVRSLVVPKVPLHKDRLPVNLQSILSNVDKEAFADAFIDEFERLVSNRELHGIWKNNGSAFRRTGPNSYSNCIIFAEMVKVVGSSPEVLEITDFAVPITQVCGTGMELLQFARNSVQVAIQLELENKLERIRAIVKAAVDEKSPVFTSPDLHSVDDFIAQMRGKP